MIATLIRCFLYLICASCNVIFFASSSEYLVLIRPRVGFAVGHFNGNFKDVTGGLNITLFMYLIALYMFSLNRLWSGQFLRHNRNIRLGLISIELKLGLDNGIVLQDSYLGLCWRNIKEAQYIVYNFFEGSCSLVSKSHWRSR